MAQNRDRNWQDRDQPQRGGGWQGGDNFAQGEHDYQHGFAEAQGQGSWDQGREQSGSGQQQPGWQGGYGQQQGGEWNRMGRYSEEGWQGGGQGRFGQGGNERTDRDFGQSSAGRSSGRSPGSFSGSGSYGSDGMGRPYVGELSGARGTWGGRSSSMGSGSAGSGGMGSRGSYGTGSYGSASSYGSGYGTSYGQQGSSYGQQGGGQQRGFLDRATDEVSSWFGDDEARRRREMDEHRGRGPKGYTRSDERIREDVNDRLTDDGWLDASDIDVQVSSSEVTLTGLVNSREEKRRAEDIVDGISGVKHVQNNLRVKDRSSAASPERSTTELGGSSSTGTSSTAGSSGSPGSSTPGSKSSSS